MDFTEWRMAAVAAAVAFLLIGAAARRHRRGESLSDVLGLVVWVPLPALLAVLFLIRDDGMSEVDAGGRTEVTGVSGLIGRLTTDEQITVLARAVIIGLCAMGVLWLWRRSVQRGPARNSAQR